MKYRQSEFQAEMHQKLCGESENATVNGFGNDYVVTGTQQPKHRIDGSHPGGKNVSALAALEFRYGALKGLPVGMLGARIVEAFILAQFRLHIGRSLIDRRDNGAGRGSGSCPT